MSQPKTITLLSTFSSEDWRECGYYLRGQYREGNDMLVLYQALKQHKLRLVRPVFDIDEVRLEHFKKATKKHFNNLLSKLYGKIEEYFIHHALKQDEIQSKLTLLKALSDRGLYKEFDKKAEELEQVLLDENRVDLYDELHLMQLNHMRFFSDNPIKDKNGIELLNSTLNYTNVFIENYKTFMESVVIHFEEVSGNKNEKTEQNLKNDTLKLTVDQLLKIKVSKSQKSFKELFTTLNKKTPSLSTELKAVTLQYLINYGHKETKSGNLKIGETLLDLYDLGFKNGLLLTNHRIPETRFINVVNLAVAYSKEERAYEIIDQFSYLLEPKSKKEICEMAYGYIDFYQERYSNVIDRIKDFPFKSMTLITRRRWMILCSYYMIHKHDQGFMSHQIKNYNSFFYNNKEKLSKTVYEGSLNLSKAIYMLQKKESPKSIRDFLNNCKQLFHRSLIIKEVEALKASTSLPN